MDQFCFFDHPIRDLHGATLGIIGEGVLGQATAQVARGFGMQVLFADHPPPRAAGVSFTPLEQVLTDSDVISLHVPLSEHDARPDRQRAAAQDEAHGAADQHRPRRAGG